MSQSNLFSTFNTLYAMIYICTREGHVAAKKNGANTNNAPERKSRVVFQKCRNQTRKEKGNVRGKMHKLKLRKPCEQKVDQKTKSKD